MAPTTAMAAIRPVVTAHSSSRISPGRSAGRQTLIAVMTMNAPATPRRCFLFRISASDGFERE